MYTSIERILSVDHWPLKRKDIQLIIDFDLYINWLNVGVRLENVPKISVKWSQTSKASSLVSIVSKPSAGARWQRPAIGWPVSASYFNCFNYFDYLVISIISIILIIIIILIILIILIIFIWLLNHVLPFRKSVLNWQNPVVDSISGFGWNYMLIGTFFLNH